MTKASTLHPADAVFRKASTGLNPFSTRHDWALLGAFLAFIAAALLFGGYRFGYSFRLLPIVTGSLAGMLPSLVILVPVRGVVPGRAHGEWLAQLADSGFMQAPGAPGEERFVQRKKPNWLRWDANSASLRRRPDGDFDATVPLHVYKKLLRHARQPADCRS